MSQIIVDTINMTKDIIISNIDTDSIANLAGIVITELKGMKEDTFINILSELCILKIAMQNTNINIILIEVILELISSVFDTKAPKVPNINA